MEFNSQTAIAFVRLLVGLAGGVFASLGWAFDADFWLNIGMSVIAIILAIYMLWWKNNNVTNAAQAAQEVLNEIKHSDTALEVTVYESEDE